jgi:hypothetical protein
MAFRYVPIFQAAPHISNVYPVIPAWASSKSFLSLSLQDTEDGKEEIERKYTPTSSDDDLGLPLNCSTRETWIEPTQHNSAIESVYL